MSKSLTYEYVKSYIEDRGCELLSDTYIRSKDKLHIRCICGNEDWYPKFNDFKKGILCSICGQRNAIEKRIETMLKSNRLSETYPQISSEWHPYKNGNLKPSDVCSSSHKKVFWLCPVCGNEYEATPCNRTGRKSGCSICSHEKSGKIISKNHINENYNLEALFPRIAEEWCFELNNGIIPSEVSYSSHTKYYWKCNLGHIYYAAPNCRTGNSKSKCPYCNGSSGEKIITEFLERNNIEYIFQKRFDDCKNIKPLPFDFYLPKYLTCIEFQGLQHYKIIDFWVGVERFESQILCDSIKEEFCLNNNLKLLKISILDIDKIETILEKELSSFSERRNIG
jgi:hypothetical protein